MSFKRLNEAFDLLNKVSDDRHINNDVVPTKAQEAKKFYGNKVRSRGAENLENMRIMSPSQHTVKGNTPPGSHAYLKRKHTGSSGLCEGLSPTKIRRLLRSPSQNRLKISKKPSSFSAEKDLRVKFREGQDIDDSHSKRSYTDPNPHFTTKDFGRHLMPLPTPRKLNFSSEQTSNSQVRYLDGKENNNQKLSLIHSSIKNIPSPDYMGFPNKGLTCYINATLQALLAQPLFYRSLLSLERQIKKWPSDDGMLKPLCRLARWKEERNSNKLDRSLSWFRRKLVQSYSQFRGVRNQDAHEFLVILCDAIEEQCKSYVEKNLCDKKENDKNLLKPPFPAHTLMKDFSFQIRETKQCHLCSHKEKKISCNTILKLVMPSTECESDNLSLESLISKTLNSTENRKCLTCTDRKHKLGYDEIEDSPHQLSDYFVKLPHYLIIYCPRIEIHSSALDELDAESKISFRKNRISIDIPDSFSMMPFTEKDLHPEPNSERLSNGNQNSYEQHISLEKDTLSTTINGSNLSKSTVLLRDTLNQPKNNLSNDSCVEENTKVITSNFRESPNRLSMNKIFNHNSPLTPDKSPNKTKFDGSDISDSPIIQTLLSETPEKFKNLNDDQIAHLSEADQLDFVMRASLKTTPLTPNNALGLTDEEQLAEAINASLRENKLAEEQEHDDIVAAINNSLRDDIMPVEKEEKWLSLATNRSESQRLAEQDEIGNEDTVQDLDAEISGINSYLKIH